MIENYNRTFIMTEERLRGSTVRIKILDKVKYDKEAQVEEVQVFTGLIRWKLVSGKDAEEYDRAFEDEPDDNHEYLVLEFNDLTRRIYRNSYVDMFIE